MAPPRLIWGAVVGHLAGAVTDGTSLAASLDQLAASPGLHAPCKQAISKLSAELDEGSTRLGAMFTLTQAAVATGRIMEALPLLNLGFQTGVPKTKTTKDLLAMYPFVSPGSPDSCAYINDFHYCRIDAASVYVRFGLCVPSACGSADVAVLINNTYHNHDITQGLFGGSIDNRWLTPLLRLEQTTRCGPAAYAFTPTTATYVMAGVTAALVCLAALATSVEMLRHRHKAHAKERAERAGYDGVQHDGAATRWFERDGTLMKSMMCWSLLSNVRALTAKQRGGPFDSLDGIRALSATWVVFAHTYLYGGMNLGYTNVYNLLEANGHVGLMGTYAAQALPGGFFSVDTFLFISAFLAVYLMLKALQQREKPRTGSTLISSAVGAPRIFVLRYLRLTPAYAYVLFMYWHVLRIADQGPFFTGILEPEFAACERSWYRNLLYVNNLFNVVEDQRLQSCYAVTWYLALDFQLFLLTPLVAGLAYWRHTWALALLAFCLIASVAWAYVESVRQRWSIDTLDDTSYINTYYMKPWSRAPPYLIGMGLAVIWHTYFTQRTGGQTPKTTSTIDSPPRLLPQAFSCPDVRKPGVGQWRQWTGNALLYTSILLFGVLVLGGRGAIGNADHPWARDRMSVFLALSKPAWSFGLAFLSLSLFTGHGGWIKSMLQSWPLLIVSRLTYCVYLVHVSVIQWLYAMVGPTHWSVIWCIVVYLGVLCTVLLLATAVYLLVESPMCALLKLVTSKHTQGAKPPRSKAEAGIDGSDDTTGNNERGEDVVKMCVRLQTERCESKFDSVSSSKV